MPRKRKPTPKRMPGHLKNLGEGRWRFYYSIRGKRDDVYLTAANEAEAYEKLAPTIALILQGRQPESTKDWTLGRLFEEWLRDVRPPSQSTKDFYARYAQRLADRIGKVSLRELEERPLIVANLKNDLLEAGYAATYVNHQLRVLKMALRWGVSMRILASDPSADVKLPRPVRSITPVIYTPEQLTALDRASGDAEYARPNRIRMRTGLRPAEVCGLQWANVDLEKGVVKVERHVVRLLHRGLVLAEPNTKGRVREVGLSAEAVEILRDQKVWQNELRVKLRPGVGWKEEHGLVFTTKFGTMLDPIVLGRGFHEARKRAGLPYARPYDLRHAFATYQLAGGAPVKDVAEIMGHDPMMLLKAYAQTVPGVAQKLANAMEAVLEAGKAQPATEEGTGA